MDRYVCSIRKDAEEEGFKELAEKFRKVAAIEKLHEERYRALLNNVEMQRVFEKVKRPCGMLCLGHLVVGKKALMYVLYVNIPNLILKCVKRIINTKQLFQI